MIFLKRKTSFLPLKSRALDIIAILANENKSFLIMTLGGIRSRAIVILVKIVLLSRTANVMFMCDKRVIGVGDKL